MARRTVADVMTRQVVFLPGFSRTAAGSSLSRGSAHKRPREPSTIDAPAPSGVAPGAPGPGPG